MCGFTAVLAALRSPSSVEWVSVRATSTCHSACLLPLTLCAVLVGHKSPTAEWMQVSIKAQHDAYTRGQAYNVRALITVGTRAGQVLW